MAADEPFTVQPDSIGKQQNRQQNQRCKNKECLALEGCVASQKSSHFGQHSNDRQVNAGQQDGEGIVENSLGWVNIQVKVAGAEKGAQDKRTREQQRAGIEFKQ